MEWLWQMMKMKLSMMWNDENVKEASEVNRHVHCTGWCTHIGEYAICDFESSQLKDKSG